MYSLIVRGWHNRAHTPIDTLHGIKYSLAIISVDILLSFPRLYNKRSSTDFKERRHQFARLNKLSE